MTSRFFTLPLVKILYEHLIKYPTPMVITYWWNFGSLAGIALLIQIITGIFLAMHYTPNIEYAFSSVEHIMRDVNYGWLLRYIHANGASMFFIVVYLHIYRGFLYGSFKSPRELVWIFGIIILLLMMATAFLGYVLPWGQMSFWGATVITNLFSAIPVVGESIVQWLWGGFSVDNATLNRFFSFHYLLPFLIVAFVVLHIAALHNVGSGNPAGFYLHVDKITFYPYFYVKDLLGFFVFIFFFGYLVVYNPNLLGHPDNYIPANPMVTPAHIVPEWYFLPFYAILRSIPDKLGGVSLMFLSIVILFVLPFLSFLGMRSSFFRPGYFFIIIFFLIFCLQLGWLGGNPVENPFVDIGQICSLLYFLFFVWFLPSICTIELHIFDSWGESAIVSNLNYFSYHTMLKWLAQ